jgi:hypothetical protein
VLVLSLLIKLAPGGHIKHLVLVVMSINAIHFWRDPIDIAVKDVAQDLICALAFLCIPSPRSRATTGAAPDV